MADGFFPPSADHRKTFAHVGEAVSYIRKIYDANTAYLRNAFQALTHGQDLPERVSACYPYAAITVGQRDLRHDEVDPRLSYGFVSTPGRYVTTLTRPDIFANYYGEMLDSLIRNHGIQVEVGVSQCPIPVHYAFPNGIQDAGNAALGTKMREVFDLVDLSYIDDRIVDGTTSMNDGERPLALYTAPRVDFSMQRLLHYTGTSPAHFQNFVLFTNYSFYVDEFRRLATEIMQRTDDTAQHTYRTPYTSFVEPGNHTIHNQNIKERSETGYLATRVPQMPAYHLKRADGNGITLVNIGVGPSNAKTISDHIATLRPHAWIMVGHCGGLRTEMSIGDYVLAHGYDRRDLVLDSKLPLNTAIPALAEIQQALQQAVERITGQRGQAVREFLRTGTVVTVADRNWELDGLEEIMRSMNPSRPIAVDMESATLATNGFRSRVPYGTFLCVSDKPLHGESKMPGSAEAFYRDRVNQHFKIGIQACELLRKRVGTLHSRKLRSSFEPPFR